MNKVYKKFLLEGSQYIPIQELSALFVCLFVYTCLTCHLLFHSWPQPMKELNSALERTF